MWDYVNAKKIDTITAEESEKLLTQIHEDAERQRLALTTKNQAAMATAESEQRLAAIDYQQKMGLISPAQGISAKLGENQSLLSSLEGWKAGLEAAGQTGDQVYQSILQKIKAVEKATTDLTVANQVYVGSFGEGMKIEILKYSASVNSAFNAGASLANTASKAMENSFTSFFDATSKKFLDFNSLALSVFGDIERQAIKLAISQPLTNSIMGSLGGLFGGGTQVVPGIAGGLPANAPYVPGSAHGNLFSGGHLVPFGAGGIVDSPVIFPMASGAGIMGEGGRPEAVMPLTRTSSGDLGVRAAGTGAPSMMTNVTINTPPGTKVAKQTETKRFDGRQWVKNLSIDLAATDLEYQSAHGLR
jgi:lambda family phage tail tape measure protein